MIVGQEANGHTFDYVNWGHENWQEWAIAYLDFQCCHKTSGKWNFSKNHSPFWAFINKLKESGYGVCWNNIDKARRYVQVDGNKYSEDYLLEQNDNDENKDRSILHKKIFDGKSLLQKEIEIAQPDAIVFAIGPKNPYYHTLSLAFFDGDKVDGYLNERGVKYPQLKDDKYCIDISRYLKLDIPAFYTYHPNYLQLKKLLDDVVKIITKNKI